MSDSSAEVAPVLTIPKLFISYSWSSPEHETWVISLAEELIGQGIEVVLDKWDLKTGHDANAFMEQMVSDPAVTKVLLICDKKYAEKSDARAGGAGTEAQIITPEIYSKKARDKYAAVVRERDEEGHPCLPVYYKGRIFIDLSDESIYAIEFDKLVRWTWDKPLNIKPPIGKPPSFVTEESRIVKMATSVPFRRALDAIRQNRANAVPATIEYLDTVVSEMENFRIAATHANIQTFDEEIIGSIEAFLPYRNELVELFMAIASYLPTTEMVEALHRFFERLMPFFNAPENVSQSFEIDRDNIKFVIHELFLCCIGAFIKYERFNQAAFFMETDYYYSNQFTNEIMHSYRFFREHLRSFQARDQRLSLRRLSLRADTLKQRAGSSGLDFKYMMTADFVLYLRSQNGDVWHSWWPETLLYVTFRSRLPFEVFARAKSAKYFDRIKPLLGVTEKAALEAIVAKIRGRRAAPHPKVGVREHKPTAAVAPGRHCDNRIDGLLFSPVFLRILSGKLGITNSTSDGAGFSSHSHS